MLLGNQVPREALGVTPALIGPGDCHGALEHSLQPLGQNVGISGRDQQAVRQPADGLTQSAHVRHHHRCPAGEGLQSREPESLQFHGGDNRQVGGLVARHEEIFVHFTNEVDEAFHVQGGNLGFEARTAGTITYHEPVGIAIQRGRDLRPCLHHDIQSHPRNKATYGYDDRSICRQAEPGPSSLFVPRPEVIEVHSWVNDLDVPRAHPIPLDKQPAKRLRENHKGRRPPVHGALDQSF